MHLHESDDIPESIRPFAEEKRQELIETVADADEQLAELFIDEKPIGTEELAVCGILQIGLVSRELISTIQAAIRRATVACQFTPVMMGTALGNKGVQPLLDSVCAFLPDPAQVTNVGLDVSKSTAAPTSVQLSPAGAAPLVGLAFKLEEGKYGQLTYIRVYQGELRKGMTITNTRTGKKVKVPRLVRMHSEEMEDVDHLGAGEICAMFGVECSSGDTFTDGSIKYSMTSMFVPEPVISLSIRPKGTETPNFSKALNRFQKEDPTFRVHVDNESQEVCLLVRYMCYSAHTKDRPSFQVWANCIWTSTSSVCEESTMSNALPASLKWHSEKPLLNPPHSTTLTRNRPVALVSMVKLLVVLNP